MRLLLTYSNSPLNGFLFSTAPSYYVVFLIQTNGKKQLWFAHRFKVIKELPVLHAVASARSAVALETGEDAIVLLSYSISEYCFQNVDYTSSQAYSERENVKLLIEALYWNKFWLWALCWIRSSKDWRVLANVMFSTSCHSIKQVIRVFCTHNVAMSVSGMLVRERRLAASARFHVWPQPIVWKAVSTNSADQSAADLEWVNEYCNWG